MIWILLLLVGVTISLGNAWRLWFRRHPSKFEKWRGMVLLLGLLAASLRRSHVALGVRIVSLRETYRSYGE